jgi:hypothetical protein
MSEKPNLKAVTTLLVNGEHLNEGDVIPKTAFAVKGDWQNLVLGFNPPRMEETDEPVGKVKKAKPAMPGKVE